MRRCDATRLVNGTTPDATDPTSRQTDFGKRAVRLEKDCREG